MQRNKSEINRRTKKIWSTRRQ